MKTLRTAEYGRVSHDEQAKFGFSISNQIERLDKYAEDNNLMIVDRYIDEGYSAGTKKRPELQRLLSELHRFDLIIFTKLDRFTRNVLDANEMVQLFERQGISIRAIDEEDVDTSTADGMFMFNLKVSLAQRELKKGSERINTVFDYKIRNGQPITGGIPMGYKIDTDANGIKRVVQDETESEMIEEIFTHFLTYQSIRKVALHINEKYNRQHAYITYNRILKNSLYAGIYRGNESYCEPYITKEHYEKNQELIKKNIRVRKNNYIYLFSGLVACPNCGRSMTGLRNKNKYNEYYYYRCNHSKITHTCDAKYIKEEMIEDFLLQNINSLVSEYIVTAAVEIDKKPKPIIDVKEIAEEIDRINLMFRKGRMKESEYDYEYDILERKLADAKRMMPEESDLTGLEAFLNSGWENVYHALEKADKRALYRSIIRAINISRDGEITVDFL